MKYACGMLPQNMPVVRCRIWVIGLGLRVIGLGY